MSQNHNVSIVIEARNLSAPEFQKIISDLRGIGTAADIATAELSQTGDAARKAGTDLKSVDVGASSAVGSLSRIVETAAGVAIGNMLQDAPRLMFEFAKASFSAASAFNESMSKVEVVFGRASQSIIDWSEDAATAFGLSQGAALDAAGSFGNLFTSMGLGQSAAAEMSTGIVQLAADLGSFNNIGTDLALDKLRAGLVGEIEPLRSLGVNINAVMVQQKALSMGLAATAKELTAADKAQASYALILEQTTNAQGDFVRTSDGAANSLKTMWASVDDLQVAIGTMLTPAVADYATEMGSNIRMMTVWIEKIREADSAVGNLATHLGDESGQGPLSRWFDVVKKGGPQLYLLREGTAAYVENLQDTAEALGLVAEKADSLPNMAEYFRAVADAVDPEPVTAYKYALTELFDVLQKGQPGPQAGGTTETYFKQVREELAKTAEMAGLANERNSEYFHSLELGSGVAAELAFSLSNLSEAQDALSGAYQIGLQIQSDYTAQGSEYASQAATIEKALEVQKERLDAGAISQEEYNRYLERGTQAIDRYEGGVQDATLTAADYAIQNAELMRIQDEIQAQFPGLVQGSAEYNQKLEEAATKAGISQQAIDDMKGSNGNLAGVIANELVPALQDLINKILELDGKKATVTVETNFISTGGAGPGAVGFTEFAEGGLVTRPTLALIGEAGPEVVVPLNQLPASAKADLLGNQQGQGNITLGQAGWLPFVEGLVGDLDAAAQAFSAEGLGHAQLFSETASQGVSLMMDGLGLLLALSETPPRYGPDIEAGIGALVELSWKVAHYTGEAAKGLVAQDGFLEGGKAFSDAAAEGIDTLAGGLELLQSLSASDAIWNPEIEERLKGLVELSWKAAYFMGEAAKGLVAQDGFLVGATVFGEAASASLGTLSDALSFLSDVSEVAADSALVTDDIGMRLVQLADVARLAADEVLRAGATWVGEVNPSLALFASGASDSLGLLGDVLGMLESLHDAEGGALSFGADFADLFGQMGDVARLAADAIAATSDEWQASVNPQIEAFREAAGDSLSLMADVGRSLDSILKFGEEDRPEDLQGLSAEMARTVSIMVQAVEIINAEWQARGAPNITEFADGAGKAVALMSGVAGAFEAIAGSSAISAKQVVVFKRNFEIALELIGELADLAEPYQDDAERFLEIIESIAEAIGTAADIISTVAGEGAGTAAQAAKGLASVGQSMGTYDGSLSGLSGVSGGTESVGGNGGTGGGYAAPNVAGSSVGFLDMYGVGGSAGGLATPGNLANSQGVKTWKQYEAWVNDMLAKGYVELVNGQPIFTKKYYVEQLGWIEYNGTLYNSSTMSPEQVGNLQANTAYQQGTWATGGKKATLPTSPGQRGDAYGKQTLSKADIDAIAKAVEKGAKSALAGAI